SSLEAPSCDFFPIRTCWQTFQKFTAEWMLAVRIFSFSRFYRLKLGASKRPARAFSEKESLPFPREAFFLMPDPQVRGSDRRERDAAVELLAAVGPVAVEVHRVRQIASLGVRPAVHLPVPHRAEHHLAAQVVHDQFAR